MIIGVFTGVGIGIGNALLDIVFVGAYLRAPWPICRGLGAAAGCP
ncbi:MAG: hypothetical protein Q8N53_15505 [Longimicrobiales bacterium]|nr:hypothetical protein [Longimicrobiales bacterium]